ncbi:hypothetical protein [Actinomadura atramentaria]|uniref:hypothetical protein n=1 Tax=Actinomadura atramentaria TaxID=1990 RepID=UPI000369E127|nr:hypothetical protein [Actinomadura atramentaria]
MRTTTYGAVVTVDSTATSIASPPGPSHRVGVRIPGRGASGPRRLEALLTTEDDEPLRPGDHARQVTLVTTDERAHELLTTGTRFELWTRHLVGQGAITRRRFV